MTEKLENTPETFEKLITETNDYKDKYLRAIAEMENLKKRVERDKVTSITFANKVFALDLLETLDNFEKVISVDMPPLVSTGINAIYNALKKTLKKHKIVECKTDIFDANIHDAVSYIKSDDSEKTIETVLRKGYFIGEKLLRPAMVVVKG